MLIFQMDVFYFTSARSNDIEDTNKCYLNLAQLIRDTAGRWQRPNLPWSSRVYKKQSGLCIGCQSQDWFSPIKQLLSSEVGTNFSL